jgi:hypothetical protein
MQTKDLFTYPDAEIVSTELPPLTESAVDVFGGTVSFLIGPLALAVESADSCQVDTCFNESDFTKKIFIV